MSDLPNLPAQDPFAPEDPPSHPEIPVLELVHLTPESAALQPHTDAPLSDYPQDSHPNETPQLFKDHFMPEMRPQERIPNIGHLGILILLALCGLFGAGLLAGLAVHFHLFGISNVQQAATDIHYTLGTEGVFYVLTFAACLLVFPFLWHKGFFAGLQWRGATALKLRGRLVSAAAVCFVLALFNSILMPGPTDAPIDRIFRMPGAAWLLFGFGVTLAPFFEELAFRGFLLPSLSIAFDWIGEKFYHQPRHPLDENGHPQWSIPAMCVAAVITSILFALIHGDQTGWSLGPFLLLVCVSLVLCWARLSTRSLAASVLVHASYNFLLFTLMFLGTNGFKHLDKM